MFIYNYNNRYILFNFASKKIDVYLSNEKIIKDFEIGIHYFEIMNIYFIIIKFLL